MKILLLTNLYPPISRGGAEKIAQRVVEGLRSRGHRVLVVSTKPFDGLASLHLSADASDLDLFRLAPLNLYHTLQDYRYPFLIRALWHLIDLWSPWTKAEIRNFLEKEKPDVILTHNLKGLGLGIARAIRMSGIPWMHTVHDVQLSVPSGLLFYGDSLKPSFLRRRYEKMVQALFGSPDVVISPSHFLADFYRDQGFFPQSQIKVLPNPAPPFSVIDRSSRPAGPLRLLFAGQWEKHKGLLFLLDALQHITTPIELHLAGTGTLASFASTMADQDARLHFHGFLSFEKLQNLFHLMDAVVVPSLCYENSPNIVYESLGSGVPVLAAKIGGVGELIQEGRMGHLFEPNNSPAFIRLVKDFDQEKELFWSRADEMRSAMKPYQIECYLDQLEQAMRNKKALEKGLKIG